MNQPRRLCLNMIVKNETANLERCLRAVAGHISCWVIGDTGSTDGTQDLIKHFFAARSIPGELHSFPFENFAQARNEALDRARASPLAFDYLLLTDADMELTVQDPDFPNKLNAAAYKVLQYSGVSYWNNRLLRRDAPAGYRGVTHEFLDVRAGETKNLVGIRFVDHATGANRVDKYDRDIRLLTGAIAAEQDPGMIARYNFYLANTLRDSGNKQAALTAYAERASLGGWPQEVFISLLNVAKIKEELQYPAAEVISAYEAATTACPTRAEALHAASRYCRTQSLYRQGYEFAARGLAIAYPDDALFVEDWAYEYGLLDELAIAAYWTERYEESQAACDRLLSEGKLPDNQRDRVLKNKNFAIGKQQEIAALASPADGEFLRLLRQARALEAQSGDDDEIIAAYEQATAASVARAEALHDAARFCRNKARYEQGYAFASRGLAINPPADAPAAERWIYEYGLLDELAVTAYWTARYDECIAACDRLLTEGKLPVDQADRVLANKNFALGRRDKITAGIASIPRIFHFITGLDENFGGKPFSFIHYMAVRSALAANPGFRAKVYYHFEPGGHYWDAIKADVEPVRVDLPAEVFGNPVEHFAHKADVLRMRILLEQGGIYLDLDTICQRPFAPLLDGRVVMGREERVLADGSRQTVGLCNATIIAPPGAEFIRQWYEAYRDFKGGPSGDSWNKFSVQIPMQLANEHADTLRIEPASSFFWPSWDSAGIDAMFAADREFPEAYSFHLWESQSWPLAKNLDAETILKVDTTYNKIARKFIGTDALLTGNGREANMVNEDMVRAAYRVLLGREPESQTAINWHLQNAENPEIMLRNFIDSAEFKLKNARGGPGMQETMLDLLSKFTPSGVTGYTKIRVGNQTGDGGYVMLDDFTDIAGALSAGIGNDVTWDLDIAGHGVDVYQFDHTVSGPPVAHERFKFFPRMISSIAADGSESIKTMIEKIPDQEGRLIMKIDIEGAEWDALDAAELSDLRRFSQIVGEFHNFSNAPDSNWRERALRVITKLNEVFQIVHLHANNWQPLQVIANVPFADVIEIAFANRSMYKFKETVEIFPTALDRPNHADIPDIFLGSLIFKREAGSEAH